MNVIAVIALPSRIAESQSGIVSASVKGVDKDALYLPGRTLGR